MTPALALMQRLHQWASFCGAACNKFRRHVSIALL